MMNTKPFGTEIDLDAPTKPDTEVPPIQPEEEVVPTIVELDINNLDEKLKELTTKAAKLEELSKELEAMTKRIESLEVKKDKIVYITNQKPKIQEKANTPETAVAEFFN